MPSTREWWDVQEWHVEFHSVANHTRPETSILYKWCEWYLKPVHGESVQSYIPAYPHTAAAAGAVLKSYANRASDLDSESVL